MNEQIFNTRIVHKHDVEVNWLKVINFIPKEAELIIYDSDENYSYPRIKIGDGVTKINDLPFLGKNIEENLKQHLQDMEVHMPSWSEAVFILMFINGLLCLQPTNLLILAMKSGMVLEST